MKKPNKLCDQVDLALKTLRWLVTNGCKPLNQQAGNFPKPVILIEHNATCQHIRRRYGAEIIGRGNNELGPYANWQADIDGCLVEWVEIQHA